MAFYNFDDLTKWRIVPLRSIIFGIGDDTYAFGNLKSQSQFSLTQITRPGDRAYARPVGYIWKVDAVILQNNMHTMQETLHHLSTDVINGESDLIISLAGIPEQPNSSSLAFKFSVSGATARDTGVLWGFKVDESGEALTLSLQGILSIDALSADFIYGGANF